MASREQHNSGGGNGGGGGGGPALDFPSSFGSGGRGHQQAQRGFMKPQVSHQSTLVVKHVSITPSEPWSDILHLNAGGSDGSKIEQLIGYP